MSSLLQDLRYGLRMLVKSPGFTAVAVITLALGIGANTAIFSLIDAVMLKMLPVKNPEQLVLLSWATRQWPGFLHSLTGNMDTDKTGRTTSTSFSYPAFDQLRNRSTSLSNLFAFASLERLSVNINGQTTVAEGEMVSGEYFSGLGVAPALGRLITPEDDRMGKSGIAVISYGYWQRNFGGDGSAAGKAVTLNGSPFTIVGVTPPEFFGVEPGHGPEIWVPLSTQPLVAPRWSEPGISLFNAGDNWWIVLMGRLKPGVSEAQARPELEGLLQQAVSAAIHPPPIPRDLPQLQFTPAGKGLDSLRGQFSKPLFILMAVVGLVLLIACANVANLLLARATARQREIAVRGALGAGRLRLIRQLLTESTLLATVGGACGLLIAYWTVDGLLALISGGRHPVKLEVHPDPVVFGFTAAISMLTGILFGLVPSLRTTRVDIRACLKESAQGFRRSGIWGLGRILVMAQVALSLLLLIGAGLFVRTLQNLQNENLGFDRHNLLLFGVDPEQSGYKGPKLLTLYAQLHEGIRGLPGVRSASLSQHTLIRGGMSSTGISVKGYTLKPGEKYAEVWRNTVGPDFLETMGIRLVAGRDIGFQDTENSPKVAIVNESAVRRYFGNSNPLGRSFGWYEPRSPSTDQIEIVGVAQDTKYNDIRREPPPTVYVPFRQMGAQVGAMHFEVRTFGDPGALIGTLRRAFQEVDKDLPLFDITTQTEQIDEALLQERLFAKLSSFFSALALLLASVGLYGVMAYSVARRTSEIGIRIALGAQRTQVLWMVLRESLASVIAGVAIGLALALATTRLVASQLFGLKSTDPLTIALATILLVGVAAFAAYLPARRAAKVDPMVALRYE